VRRQVIRGEHRINVCMYEIGQRDGEVEGAEALGPKGESVGSQSRGIALKLRLKRKSESNPRPVCSGRAGGANSGMLAGESGQNRSDQDPDLQSCQNPHQKGSS
jgi:hypothetical protein